MNFKTCIKEGKVRKISIDTIRAKSVMFSSEQAVSTAKEIFLKENSLKTILRELYEGLREYCEALGYLTGYKFLDHTSIVYFLKDILKEESISLKFDRYRRLRNGINYYGREINIQTVKEALKEIPKIINLLKNQKSIPNRIS